MNKLIKRGMQTLGPCCSLTSSWNASQQAPGLGGLLSMAPVRVAWVKSGFQKHCKTVPRWSMHACMYAQSCQTLSDPMDCSPPGFSVLGIFQARTLEWVAVSFSRGPSRPRDRTGVSRISCLGRQTLYYWSTWEANKKSHTSYKWGC